MDNPEESEDHVKWAVLLTPLTYQSVGPEINMLKNM